MKRKITSPSQESVDLGDLLAISNVEGLTKLFPIIRKGSHYAVANGEKGECLMRYDCAIVIKKNGSVLIGNSVYNQNSS